MIGIYPPNDKVKLNENEKKSLSSGKAMPKLKIRNKVALAEVGG